MENTSSYGKKGKQPWFDNPWKLLFAAAAAWLIWEVLTKSIALAAALPGMNEEGLYLAMGIVSAALAAGLGLAFIGWIKAARKKRGLDLPLDWRRGPSFWAALPLVAVYCWLSLGMEHPVFGVVSLLAWLARGFGVMVALAVLLPVLDRRFGLVKSELLLAGAAVLAACARTGLALGASAILASAQNHDLVVKGMSIILHSLLPSCLKMAASAAIAVLVYRLSARRVPGAWLLSLVATGFVGFGANAQANPTAQMLVWLACLLLALGTIAVLGRWRSWQDFTVSAKKLADRVITMGEEE